MINNLTNPNGEGNATGVQNITLQSPNGTPWSVAIPGVATNVLDLGLLNLNSNFIGINTGFADHQHQRSVAVGGG
ncbi:MAG: hypothetical protein U1E60_01760 [Reyranellaceae bacterium]